MLFIQNDAVYHLFEMIGKTSQRIKFKVSNILCFLFTVTENVTARKVYSSG
jgi:hypothetical protein